MTYQLIKVPATNLHVASILVQAFSEAFGIRFAASWAPAIVLIPGLVGLAGHTVIRLLGLRSGRAGAATEKTPNGMADRRAYSNSTTGQS